MTVSGTGNGNLQPEIEINKYSSSTKLLVLEYSWQPYTQALMHTRADNNDRCTMEHYCTINHSLFPRERSAMKM